MALCTRCGQSLGFFEGGPTCKKCTAFLTGALAAWNQRLESAFADRLLTEQEEADLRAYQRQLGLTDREVAPLLPKLYRAKQLTAINLGRLPTVPSGNIMLPRGETCHFAASAALYQEHYQRHYVSQTSGGSTGVTWHGIHVGGSRRAHVGQWVQSAATVCVAQGTLAITNQNVRFVGTMVMTIPLSEILGLNYYWNAIELQHPGRAAKDFFAVDDGEMAASVLWAVRKASEAEGRAGLYR